MLGGARSGKSRFAEHLVLESGLEPVYLATAEPLDPEMAARIAGHRARRDEGWRTVEEPLDLAGTLARECGPQCAVLVDCLTLWLTNLMGGRYDVAAEGAGLIDAIGGVRGAVVLVSNEVGQGIVPDNPMARAFVDHAGRLHQALAARADAVVLLVAGLAQRLK